MDDWKLLRTFAEDGSEAAFTEIVGRYTDLVYSAALRQTRDATLAEEVTQTVFIILARKAGSIRQGTILSGWLYRTARYAAADAVKSEVRRKKREEASLKLDPTMGPSTGDRGEARWIEMEPLLDELMHKLKDKERVALVLRFFERRTLEDVGQTLHLSKDGANKRIQRALEKLRQLFARRGVTLGSISLAAALLENAVRAAPAFLSPAVAPVAIAKGAGAAASTLALAQSTMKKMFLLKVQKLLQGVAAVGVVGWALVAMAALKTPGLIDSNFQRAWLASNLALAQVQAMVVGNNGKIFIAGQFRARQTAATPPQIVRLNPDGTHDLGFQAPIHRSQIETLAFDPDGNLLIGGMFGAVPNRKSLWRMLVRLTPEGSIDPRFSPGDATNGLVRSLLVLPDGKIMVGGQFNGFGDAAHQGVVRLLTDGHVDASFRPHRWNRAAVDSLVVDIRGGIIAAGEFTATNGLHYSLIRFHEDGSFDETFGDKTRNIGRVSCLTIQSDAKIVVGIDSSDGLGDVACGLVRLNADGTLDQTFHSVNLPKVRRAQINGMVVEEAYQGINAVLEQTDGKLLIVGGFREIHGVQRRGIARLNRDGSLDLSLDPGQGISRPVPGASGRALARQADGGLLVGGSFSHFDGKECGGLVRLLPEGRINLVQDRAAAFGEQRAIELNAKLW